MSSALATRVAVCSTARATLSEDVLLSYVRSCSALECLMARATWESTCSGSSEPDSPLRRSVTYDALMVFVEMATPLCCMNMA